MSFALPKQELEASSSPSCRYTDVTRDERWRKTIDAAYLATCGEALRIVLVERTPIEFISERKRIKMTSKNSNVEYEFGAVKIDATNDRWFFARWHSYEVIVDVKHSSDEWTIARLSLANSDAIDIHGVQSDSHESLSEMINKSAVRELLVEISQDSRCIAKSTPTGHIDAVGAHFSEFLVNCMRVNCVLPPKEHQWPFCINDVVIRPETWGAHRLLVVRVRTHPSTQSSDDVLEVVMAMCGQELSANGQCPIHFATDSETPPRLCCQNSQIKMNRISGKDNVRTRVADYVPLGALRRRYMCALIEAFWYATRSSEQTSACIEELNQVSKLIARSPHFQNSVLDKFERSVIELRSKSGIIRKRVRQGHCAGRWCVNPGHSPELKR
jgi:hypothetical protein